MPIATVNPANGETLKTYEAMGEEEIERRLDETMAASFAAVTAIVAIIDDQYADRVDRAFAKAAKRVSKAVDKGDVEELQKALDKGGDEIAKALDS